MPPDPRPTDAPPPTDAPTVDRRFLPALDNPRRCTATQKQTGQRCANWAALGLTVCRYHGGATKAAKAAALRRLEALAPRAVRTLGQALKKPDSTGVAASREVLNRVLGVPGQNVSLTGPNGGPVQVVHLYAQIDGLDLPAAPGDAIDIELDRQPDPLPALSQAPETACQPDSPEAVPEPVGAPGEPVGESPAAPARGDQSLSGQICVDPAQAKVGPNGLSVDDSTQNAPEQADGR